MFFVLTIQLEGEKVRLIHQGEGLPGSNANVAQLVVRLICNQTVGGSSPSVGSISLPKTPLDILQGIHPPMPECNLDAKGKAARFVGGIASLLGAVVLGILLLTGTLQFSFGWYAVGGAVFGGAFALYEARTGWCIVRALGIKTPL